MYRSYSFNLKKFLFAMFLSILTPYFSSLLVSNFYILPYEKPFLKPTLYPIIYLILSILLGVSFYLILTSEKEKGSAVYVFIVKMFVSFVWPILFFTMRAYSFSLIWAAILWFFTLAGIIINRRIRKASSIIEAIYLIWVSYSVYLIYIVCTK